MAKRILVPVERTKAMEFTLRVVRMLASESGGGVRLLAVVPIPEPLGDRRDSVIVSTDLREGDEIGKCRRDLFGGAHD